MWEKNTIQAPVDILERSPGWGGKKFIGKKSTVVFCPPNMANCSRQYSRLADVMYNFLADGFRWTVSEQLGVVRSLVVPGSMYTWQGTDLAENLPTSAPA